MSQLSDNTILWSGTIGIESPLRDYVDAALAAGVAEISLGLNHFAPQDPPGPLARTMAAYAADNGVQISVVDGLLSWLPLGDGRLASMAYPLTAALEIAHTLNARWLNALVPALGYDHETLAEHFAAACDRAAEIGCSVHLEFSPIGGVANLADARDIIRLANRQNGGIVFDTWHFFRGDHDFEVLQEMTPNQIVAVQICDADRAVRGSLWNDTLHHRKLPGDGVFDLERVVRVLDSIGCLSRVGPEVISDDMHQLPPGEAARVACQSVVALLDRALNRPARL